MAIIGEVREDNDMIKSLDFIGTGTVGAVPLNFSNPLTMFPKDDVFSR